MRRILVIGSGGAGKSTLALRIGQCLGVPVIHLDALYWRAGWTTVPKDEWTREVIRLVAADAWVMDGNYSGTFDVRVPAADTIIFLDLPRLVCLWRIVKRRIRFHGRSRPDMSAGCPEQINLEFLDWVWKYRRTHRPRVLDLLRSVAAEKRVIVLESRRDVERFMVNLAADGRNPGVGVTG